jgi:aspartate/glutamate/aspartate-prephenate aminotransferase
MRSLAGAMRACAVDQTLNPVVSALKPSKTMALTDLAQAMKEDGIDVRFPLVHQYCSAKHLS